MNLKIIEAIADIPIAQWNALAGNNPFLSHAYLCALQESGCAAPNTGWHAQFLTLWQDDQLVGAMPLYFKTHSYGEFVFDWAWADAYQRHGLRYYPKLVGAVPLRRLRGLVYWQPLPLCEHSSSRLRCNSRRSRAHHPCTFFFRMKIRLWKCSSKA